MNYAIAIRIIMGTLGTIISSLISLSNMPKFIQIYKKKSVEDYEPWHQVWMWVKCSLWFLYGFPYGHQNDGILVAVSNGIGFIIQVVYIVVFLVYCTDEKKWWETIWWIMCVFSALALTYGFSFWAVESFDTRNTKIGVVCVTYTIVMYIVLASDTMVATESLEYMSLGLSLTTFINDGIWIAYSLIHKRDIFVLVSNGLGAFFCACQLIVNACCYQSHVAMVKVNPQPSDEQILQV